MRSNIKIAEKKPDLISKAKNEGAAFCHPNDLNNSYKYLGYMGDAAMLGLGAGMSWHALKKFVEHSYRKRLEKAIRNTTDVENFYRSRTAPVTNAYIGANKTASVKSGAEDIKPTKNQISQSQNYKSVAAYPVGKTEMLAVNKGQGFINDLASSMASHPDIANTLAFMSLPAIFAGATWAGNSLSKAVNDMVKGPDVQRMSKERAKARKQYEDAALTLRNITLGGLDKTGSMNKEAGLMALGIAGLGLAGLAGLGYGAYSLGQRSKSDQDTVTIPNPHATNNSTVNGLIGLGLGGLGLMAVPPIYRFVQSMRSGYNSRVDGISDVTRSAQAWDAVRNARGEDFATLRASLADEPETIDFESHGKRKRKRREPEEPVAIPYANYFN